MEISVILTTGRLGGIDLLQQCMAAQDFEGRYEMILVDEFYEARADKVRTVSLDNFLHLPPKRKSVIYNDTTGYNTGLAAAKGELIVFMTDYAWVPSNYLSEHWRFYKENPGWSMSCYLDRYELPSMRGDPYSVGRDWWTVFRDDFSVSLFDGKEPIYRERRGPRGKIHPDGRIEIPGEYIYLLGDSFPLALLRELNGLDERYDGSYGSNDIDLATRANTLGWKFGLNTEIRLKKFGTQATAHKIPSIGKPKVRTWEDNHRFFETRQQLIAEGKENPKTPIGWGAFV